MIPDAPLIEKSTAQQRVDLLHHALTKLPAVECPLTHRFTPGMYAREILMPAGSIVISLVHRTEHPHVMLSGCMLLWTEEGGLVELSGGHVGITKPGTRRVAYMVSDCRFVTFHATSETDLVKLEAELTERPDVSYVAALEAESAAMFRKFIEQTKGREAA